MANTLNAHKAGLAFGGALASFHFIWSLLVAFGVAQALYDWVLRLHMLQIPITVLPFSLSMAVMLVIFTGIVGYLLGYCFGVIWNAIQK
jgi:hypothetical protein